MEGVWHPLQRAEWSCKEDFAQVPQRGCHSVPRRPMRSSKQRQQMPCPGEESPEREPRYSGLSVAV